MKWLRLVLLSLILVVPAGCTSVHAAAAHVTLDEYSIQVDSTALASEATVTVNNQGEFGHTLVVSDESGGVVAATGLIPAGTTLDLAADWGPGEYRFTCRIVVEGDDGEIVDHFAAGMRADISVAQ